MEASGKNTTGLFSFLKIQTKERRARMMTEHKMMPQEHTHGQLKYTK